MPWIWDLVDMMNSWLLTMKKNCKFTNAPDGFKLVNLSDVSTEKMVEFFAQQPEKAFTFFVHMLLMQNR